MPENPLAALGTPVNSVLKKEDKPKNALDNKYSDFLKAIKAANFPEGNTDVETQLGWENIEGEIMAHVQVQCMRSGVGFTQINHQFFKFATPQQCVDAYFIGETVEQLKQKPYFMPSPSVMLENLNRLMISFDRQGRSELVQMLNAFSISMQEQERSDPMSRAFKGAHL